MATLAIAAEGALPRALSYIASIVGGVTITPAAAGSAAVLAVNGAEYREPLAIVKALAASQPSLSGSTPQAQAELAQWLDWAASPAPAADAVAAAAHVDAHLQRRSFLAGQAFTLADALVYHLVAPGVASVAAGERAARFGALLRWADQITHTPGVNVAGAAGAPAAIGSARAPLPATFSLSASSSSSSAAAPAAAAGAAGVSKKDAKAAAKAAAKKAEAESGGAAGAGAGPSPPAEASPISECDLRVGKIVEVWKHPGSDKLYCEKIDMGEASGPREIASGLVPYFTLEQMQNRRVVVVANLKPRPLAGFMSNGMVLCATSAEGKVEFVNPPEGAAIGERVTFPGHEGAAAEPNRMAKKKIFEAVAPELVVDDALRATWKGIPFTTTAGPCTVESAKGALIK